MDVLLPDGRRRVAVLAMSIGVKSKALLQTFVKALRIKAPTRAVKGWSVFLALL